MATDITEAFKYNPYTGNELKTIDLNTKADLVNGEKIYLNPKPCSLALIQNTEGKLLMVVRGRNPHKGTWDLPGGFLNLDENIEESIIRECKEELNVKIGNLKYVGSCPEVYEFGDVIHKLVIVGFSAEITEESSLIARDDVESFKFFARDEIPWGEIKFESMRYFIEKFFKHSN